MDNQLVTIGNQAVELAKLTEKELLQIYSPASIKALVRNLKTANDLIKPENNTPSLGYICRVLKNEQLALALVKLHIIDLLDFINPSRTMSIEQVEQTADLIISDYSYLKIADLLFVFKKAKKGDFGQLYEGIDGMKILQWFSKTWDERMDAAEMASQSDHLKIKQSMGTSERSNKDAASFRSAFHDSMIRQHKEKTEGGEQ